jgi:hypothetical protein
MTSVGFDYRPESEEWLSGQKMLEFPDRRQEQYYERWRLETVHQIYGSQTKKTWSANNRADVLRVSGPSPYVRTGGYPNRKD